MTNITLTAFSWREASAGDKHQVFASFRVCFVVFPWPKRLDKTHASVHFHTHSHTHTHTHTHTHIHNHPSMATAKTMPRETCEVSEGSSVAVSSWQRKDERKDEGREIRTPNLLIWSQTRCHCAMPPLNALQAFTNTAHWITHGDAVQRPCNAVRNLSHPLLQRGGERKILNLFFSPPPPLAMRFCCLTT